MRVSTSHRFVFVSTPKVGTHTIYKILEDHFADGLDRPGFHYNQIPEEYSSYYRWTMCRNPFARAISTWWSACRLAHKDQYHFRARCGAENDFTRFIVWLAGTSHEERLREPVMQNQSEWLAPVEPIHALKIEDIASELQTLPFWRAGIEIPRLNTTDKKIVDQEAREGAAIERPSSSDLLADATARDAVIQWAGQDFERFGYSREPS